MKKLSLALFLMVLTVNTFGQSTQISTEELAKLFPTKKVVSRYHNNWTQNYYPKRIQVRTLLPTQRAYLKEDILLVNKMIKKK